MNFASDNAGPVHPRVMEALMRANEGYAMPYGADAIMGRVRARIREIFEAPEAAVYLVATGTAANSILLAQMATPWQTVFCSHSAHIHEDECGAPEFFSGGAKLTPVDGPDGKIAPDALDAALRDVPQGFVHSVQRGPVSITQATEKGSLYSLDEIAQIGWTAREFGVGLHMDGARFANGLVALDCSPAEMTWKAGVDALSFGGTKNGLMGVEAAVIFDQQKAWEFELRRKRAGHLFSKHRYLSAQMDAYLDGDLWLDMARAANGAAARLASGLRGIEGVEVQGDPQANMIFAEWPRAGHRRLHEAGALYYVHGGDAMEGPEEERLTARLVCDHSQDKAAVDRFLEILRG